MPQELAKKIRAKYPGMYDDLDDATLEAKILAKYPDYKDLSSEPEEVREPGLIKEAWSAATKPIIDIRGEPTVRAATDLYAQQHPIIGGIGNFGIDLVSGLSSPLNLAFGGLGGVEAGAAKIGLPAAARLAQIGRRTLSVPVGIEGAQNLYEGYQTGSPAQGVAGGLELLGGIMGIRKGGPTTPRPSPELPIRPEVNPAITGKVPTQITFEDMFGPEAGGPALVTPEGVQTAFKNGKITQVQAVKLLEKYYAEETAKVKSKTPKVVPTETPAEIPVVKTEGRITPDEVVRTVTPESAQAAFEKEIVTRAAQKPPPPETTGTGLWEERAGDIPTTEQIEIPPVKPLDQLPTLPGLADVIKAIPRETGNTELDGMVGSLRAMRRRKGIDQFNDLENVTYRVLMNNIKNHPSLPPELAKRWNDIEIKATQTSKPEGFADRMPITETTPKGPTYIIKQENATPELVRQAKSKGYEFIGINDKGDYRFRKTTLTEVLPTEPTSTTVEPRVMSPDVTINLMRGANDPVRVVFADSIDKTIFQAFSRNKEGGFKNPGMLASLEQRFPDFPPEQVRIAARQFREDVLAQAKALPKQAESGLVGDLKIEPAKSFRDYLTNLIKSEKGELIIPGRKPKEGITVVKSGEATPEAVKKLFDAGFRFLDETETGDLRFKKMGGIEKAPILESEVGLKRPTKRGAIGELGAIQDAQKSSVVAEIFNFPRGVLASWDFSAPLRQGLPLIHKKAFWQALKPMWESWITEEGFQASQESIAKRALFKKRSDKFGEKLPSFADDAGLKLTDLTDLTKREEAIMSTWAEKVPIVRRSNRAYTSFLNNLRADVFESLIKDSNVLADVKGNLPLARSIADFVNTATGRGKLAVDIPKGLQKYFGTDAKGNLRTELSLEQSATILNTGLFAPRLIASRLKMLNPAYYIMAPPIVRKEALKSLLAIAGVGNTLLLLGEMAGAKVSKDPNSSDFGKIQIGNTRIDPWGGFQQYIVAVNRLIRPGFAKIPGLEGESGFTPLDMATGFAGTGGQQVTSSTSNRRYDLWNPRGPYDPSHLTIGGRFLRGKLNPVLGFAWSLFDAQKEMSGQKMNFSTMNPMENAIAQRFIPILMQDIYQLAKEQPELLPLAIPGALGMGIQTYEENKYSR